MFQKLCAGCDRPFTAQKQSRRWCSDACGRRSRRKNARAASGPHPLLVAGHNPVVPVVPTVKPDIPYDGGDPWLLHNIDLARSVRPGLLMDLDFIEELSAESVDVDATNDDYQVVATELARRVIALLQDFDVTDAAQALAYMSRLEKFVADEYSTRIVLRLAEELRGAGDVR
jgi:hypothetical protein